MFIDLKSDLLSIPCTMMRGGTSKGVYFLADDLPDDLQTRNELLLSVMGSPDIRQIDGIGGANPLTSKVAIISKSNHADADIDYLFLQVFVDKAIVTDAQNCGNILAGVAPFALEQGLMPIRGESTSVRIFMRNTGQIATSVVHTPNNKVSYRGEIFLDGVPKPASAIPIYFSDIAGSSCGSLLPTGNIIDVINEVKVSCVDNGMPVVLINAQDLGVSGYESCEDLDNNTALKDKLEKIRLVAGEIMNLGNVTEKSVPKITLISKAINGGLIHTRTFIPHKCHQAIGVFGAVSVATACTIPGSVADGVVNTKANIGDLYTIEHPSGETSVTIKQDGMGGILQSGIISTARKLFSGTVFVAL
ncbi:4-oxalomesaconate tautomerase [Moraxella canis]|uniref:4-oxalomesaconate tautomerase n=1 Tax=Moraxella canis TaxID=90239 RepID=A0A1S9ZJT6_9GAMM|nr:4-oxalomesaconate tautomerase [Moraxella canis]OOR83301.1 4-oxalomesaconate tautomerase [Moraxella canis]